MTRQHWTPAGIGVGLLCLAALATVNLLLPIERGFPVLRTLGVPITLPTLVSLTALVVVTFRDPSGVLITLRDKYIILQSLIVLLMVFALARSSTPGPSATICAIYFCTFVANYITCNHIIANEGDRRTAQVMVVICAAASAVGIMEWLKSAPLDFYSQFAVNRGPHVETLAYRVSGSLGNPIVYSTALLLAAPICLQARSAAGWLTAGGCVVAAATTLSRTALLVLAVFSSGFLVHRFRQSIARGILVTALLSLLLAVAVIWTTGSDVEFVRRITGEEAAATDNIVLRWQAAIQALQAIGAQPLVNTLFGNGLRAGSEFTAAHLGGFDTLDNAWLTLLFDLGLLGSICFAASISQLVFDGAEGPLSMRVVVAGFIVSGCTFVSFYYSSCNFPAVLAFAWLASHRHRRRAFTAQVTAACNARIKPQLRSSVIWSELSGVKTCHK